MANSSAYDDEAQRHVVLVSTSTLVEMTLSNELTVVAQTGSQGYGIFEGDLSAARGPRFAIRLTDLGCKLLLDYTLGASITINSEPVTADKDLADGNAICLHYQGASAAEFIIFMSPNGFLDNYRLGQFITRGSHGHLYRCYDRTTNREAAVKVIRAIFFADRRNPVLDYTTLVQRELKVLKAIGPHENILGLYNSWYSISTSYIVTEYYNGGDLFAPLWTNCYIESAARLIVKQVCVALEYMHTKGIVHRDIKLENIMFHDGVVKLVDFGLAESLPQDGSGLRGQIGTTPYMAPEVFAKHRQTEKVDCWCLAIVTQTLLLGLPLRNRYVPEDLKTSGKSKEVIFLLAEMFEPRAQYRPTMTAILGHAWFRVDLDDSP